MPTSLVGALALTLLFPLRVPAQFVPVSSCDILPPLSFGVTTGSCQMLCANSLTKTFSFSKRTLAIHPSD